MVMQEVVCIIKILCGPLSSTCTGFIFVYFLEFSDPKQVKIGVTYMTMNNIYKTLNGVKKKKTNQRGVGSIETLSWIEPADWLFVREKVDVIVLIVKAIVQVSHFFSFKGQESWD